ncbi:SusC/RagA family TonB-linked outer membrane protein [Paraflavitalea sp. CAU 1676]|uniref:SusC/RagA family TonB-linked outer membrane protein n=1 Tax=Paraflavitalea sp. CAU 1676 TaxID=3032598 RepID=UPI0023DC8471|nr:SusC/RagA family TonB-linked outer membrane protein [Paraflavitalea sp. CAU 1676]MDF2192445.1 SusC/RagA family TonB-linked outer membrane protein [Paraflavitalea sp. CAU 1676]
MSYTTKLVGKGLPLLKSTALLLFILLPFSGITQDNPTLQIGFADASVEKAFSEITQKTGVRFAYDAGKVNLTKKITLQTASYKLKDLLDKVCALAGLTYQLKNNTVTVKSIANSSNEINTVLKGKVVSDSGEPLSSVSISNQRLKVTVVSDKDGNFEIPAQAQSRLVFTSIGYEDRMYIVGSLSEPATVTLIASAKSLNEVVVTSLGIKREKKALGYAVGEVKGEQIDKARDPNVINTLAGRVPGLIISNTAGGPGSAAKVLIRGNTDITGNNQPLYVVDGVPMDNSNYGATTNDKYASGFDLGDAISAIDPNDIESISVLKGPAASALYGGRAGHGVIMITTRKGANRKSLGIELNSTATFETLLTRAEDNQYEYGQGMSGSIPTSQLVSRNTLFSNFGAKLDPNLTIPAFNGGTAPYGLVKNNIENFFRTGTTFANNIAITGGNETSTIRFSYSNLYNNDIVPKSYLNRNTFTLRGTSKIGTKLNIDVRATYMNEYVKNRPGLADDPSNIGFNFVGLANNVDQKVFEEGYQDQFGNYVEWGGGQYHLNPYWVINRMSNITRKDRLMSIVQLNYNPTYWLGIQGRINNDFTYLGFEKFSPPTTPGALTGRLDGTDTRFSFTSADLLVTMKKSLGHFDGTINVGGSMEFYRNRGSAKAGTNMVVMDAVVFNSFKTNTVTETNIRKRTNSFYSTFGLGYHGYLFLDATIRRDVSSTLPAANNSYWYPSLGASFIVSDAIPHLKTGFLNFFKVRASAAEVGNDTDPYQLSLNYGLNPLQPSSVVIGGIANNANPNAGLRPTRTRSLEAGLDMKFLNNRLGLEFTWYTQNSRDQINYVNIPFSAGFASRVINAGTISNTGVEILVTGKPVVTKNFTWEVAANAAHNKNVVKSLAEGVAFITLSDARWLGISVIAEPNLPYGTMLGYDYQRTPDGQTILDPTTLHPLASDERTSVGKGTWDWTGGLTNTFRYKNVSLTAVIDVKTGADLFSMTNLFAVTRGQHKMTLAGRQEWIQSEEARLAANKTPEEWLASGNAKGYVPQGVVQTGTDPQGKPMYTANTKPVDPNTYWPQYYGDDKGIAAPFIYDATYVKLREIVLSYNLPARLVRKISAQGISLSVVSRNPFIIHKKVPNVDPDSNYNNGNGQGLEYGSLPGRRSWGFNLNIKF